MKIHLCAITKGDAELSSLKHMIASVAQYVQGVYITTNGEHTKTKKWLEEEGYNHSHLPWDDDFSAQRNFNFAQAKDCDFIFWMDSDDELVGGQYLEEVAEITKRKQQEVAFLTYWYGNKFNGEPKYENLVDVEMQHPRERLIKPGSTTWKKRLHETPVPNEGAKYDHVNFIYSEENPIAVLHLGAVSNESIERTLARNTRNQRILELQLQDEMQAGNADPRTLLYLMKIYTESDRPDEWTASIVMGKEYLKKSGWDEERATCCVLMGRCYGYKKEFDSAIKILHEALANYPYFPTVYLRLSEAYFNKGQLREAKQWLKNGLALEYDDKTASMNNLLEIKYLSAMMSVKILFNLDKDTKKAYLASETLYQIDPSDANLKQVEYLEALSKLDEACRRTDYLTQYLAEIGEVGAIRDLINILPEAISAQPFAQRLRHKHSIPRKWGEKEICYYASFGAKAFEPWGPESLKKGVGGSETAVIMLAKEWASKGYSVTVYGDPEKERGEHDGVTYLPWYYFNPKDHFNIFIQWRNASLCDKIKCKKFLVDMHDVYFGSDYEEKQDHIDRMMVKSKYHRNLGKDILDSKFEIISNGVI